MKHTLVRCNKPWRTILRCTIVKFCFSLVYICIAKRVLILVLISNVLHQITVVCKCCGQQRERAWPQGKNWLVLLPLTERAYFIDCYVNAFLTSNKCFFKVCDLWARTTTVQIRLCMFTHVHECMASSLKKERNTIVALWAFIFALAYI